jgi:sugar/nucleoside kinase (ribokinase family)
VTDSTGAGDAVAAGIHVGLTLNLEIAQCADIAVLLAGIVSEHVGARAGQPSLASFRDRWAEQFGSAITSPI